MKVKQLLTAGATLLPGATTFTRLRAQTASDSYNPADEVADWTKPPDDLDIEGSLSSSSSQRTPDGSREQTTSTAYLTIADPDADVRLGDRIRTNPDDGRLWEVSGFPSNDINPFTGWQPTLEVSLTEWKG
ncbi:hypothetical protein BPY_23280 [Bifidobacterium psychraerophilum]|uniref:hypothetical protein n=1 Tax=Bifidobacterium psychraerophilum TaxID=218140 RepID=UPI0031125E3D